MSNILNKEALPTLSQLIQDYSFLSEIYYITSSIIFVKAELFAIFAVKYIVCITSWVIKAILLIILRDLFTKSKQKKNKINLPIVNLP